MQSSPHLVLYYSNEENTARFYACRDEDHALEFIRESFDGVEQPAQSHFFVCLGGFSAFPIELSPEGIGFVKVFLTPQAFATLSGSSGVLVEKMHQPVLLSGDVYTYNLRVSIDH